MRLRDYFRLLFLPPWVLLKVSWRWLIGLLCILFLSGGVEAGWRYYGGTYYRGCSYYGGCSYGGSYYQPGYWYYYQEPQYLTAFVYPVYIPTGFATYQPAAALTPQYQTAPLNTVAQVQQTTTTTQQAAGAAQVTGTVAQTTPADPYGCHAKTAALEGKLIAFMAEMKAEREAITLERTLMYARSPEEENAILRKALRVPQRPPTSEPERAPQPEPQLRLAQDEPQARVQRVAGLLMARCADCHHESEASKRKDGFVLFAKGSRSDKTGWQGVTLLNPPDDKLEMLVAAVASTGSDQMPPPKQQDKYPHLTAAEVADVKWLAQQLKAPMPPTK